MLHNFIDPIYDIRFYLSTVFRGNSDNYESFREVPHKINIGALRLEHLHMGIVLLFIH